MNRYATPVFFWSSLKRREHAGLGGDVERARGLVADDDRWVERERSGDRDPLALAAGELARVATAGVLRQSHCVQQLAHFWRPPSTPAALSGSTRMLSTVIDGFSDEYGSWKTTWMSVASWRRFDREMLLIRSPRKRIVPSVTGARPRMARPMVVLPEPDSPTRLRVFPGRRSKDTLIDHGRFPRRRPR